jgi:hypothetical protein
LQQEPDVRDHQILGAATEIPAVYHQDKAWAMPIYYQSKQPACGAHAAAWLKALLDEYESSGRKYTPRANWIDIKTFDGYAIEDGTDMRSLLTSLKNMGALNFDELGNDSELDLDEYAKKTALTDTMRTHSAPHKIDSYAFPVDQSWDGLKRTIYAKKGVVLLMKIGAEFWTKANGQSSWEEADVLPLRKPTTQLGGHFVVAHSYDANRIYFANSWSTDWGRNGHGYFEQSYMPYVLGMGTAVDSNDADVVVPAFQWKRDLTVGSSGVDVKELQKYLNTHSFPIAVAGDGAPGHETQYYGKLTQAAVGRWQRFHNISPSLGYFGIKSRTVLNAIMKQGPDVKG